MGRSDAGGGEISQWPKSELPRKLEWATDGDPGVGCPEVAGSIALENYLAGA